VRCVSGIYTRRGRVKLPSGTGCGPPAERREFPRLPDVRQMQTNGGVWGTPLTLRAAPGALG